MFVCLFIYTKTYNIDVYTRVSLLKYKVNYIDLLLEQADVKK